MVLVSSKVLLLAVVVAGIRYGANSARNSAEDCLTSTARREIACLRDHAEPRPRDTFLLPTEYNIDPSEHISLLSKFLGIAPFLVLQDNIWTPTMRHPDLSLSNILLIPGSSRIASLID